LHHREGTVVHRVGHRHVPVPTDQVHQVQVGDVGHLQCGEQALQETEQINVFFFLFSNFSLHIFNFYLFIKLFFSLKTHRRLVSTVAGSLSQSRLPVAIPLGLVLGDGLRLTFGQSKAKKWK
jgi:uncharacterized protein with PQ loop repeat